MIYVHVPFCRSFCTYCGFYSEVVPICRKDDGSEKGTERYQVYVKAVCAEAEARRDEIRKTLPSAEHSGYADTLYLGGGTPSLLPFRELAALAGGVNQAVFGSAFHNYQELTVEVNPEDIHERGVDYAKAVKSLGVNRVSMGVQSFDNDVLRWMNRRHDSAAVLSAFDVLRTAGFGNVSIDLIFGFGGLTDDLWKKTIEQAIALSPEHISAYQMSVERGSALSELAAAGKYVECGDEVCRRQYDILCRMLSDAGYRHYEVSNFALPGHEAIHNSAYWKRVPYSGLGPGAHSAIADERGVVIVRKWNTEVESGYVSERETLTEENIRIETVMLGLRTDAGTDPAAMDCKHVSRMLDAGCLEWNGENVRIPESMMFVSDEIIRELI